MWAYFFRRLLLIPITMFGVTLMVFALTRLVPGGPIDRALQQAAQGAEEGARSMGGQRGSAGFTEGQLEDLEEEYGYDKSLLVAYCQWLGVLPRERAVSKGEFREGQKRIRRDIIADPKSQTLVVLKGDGREVKVVRRGSEVVSAEYVEGGKAVKEEGWSIRIESPTDRQERWLRRNQAKVWWIWWTRKNRVKISDAPKNYDWRAVIFRKQFVGLLQGELGRSREFGDPVWSLIRQRIPIALYFGLLTAGLTYGVCIPLGVMKAIGHRTMLDNVTSGLIFIGYSIPGFALGALLLVYLGARLGWFPMFGLNSPELAGVPWWDGRWLLDRAHHTVLPLLAYVVGSFAVTTMMMKNNLMDHLAADYVRTAVAKGASFRRAVFGHAFRNSFIPIASGLGHLISVLVMGSLLIERVFDIQGFGLLQYQSIIGRDQPVIMGTLTISALLLMIGNLLSDLIVAMVDPRVKFD